MMTNFSQLRPKDSLQRAIELILATPLQDFPVLDDTRVVGILTSRDLMIALQQHGPDSLVEDIMRRDFLSLEANEMLDTGFARTQAAECCVTAPVLLHGELVGLLTADNVNEFLLIVSALGEHRTMRTSA